MQPGPQEPSPKIAAACAGLGAGERSIIYLATVLPADLVLIDEERARRAARAMQINIAGSIAVLERGAILNRVSDLRSVYLRLLDQGIHYDRRLLNKSLERLGLAKLQP
jgi:predicted nucleic acid-binding protein